MANFYANQVRNGKRTIDQVPARWQDAVREILGL